MLHSLFIVQEDLVPDLVDEGLFLEILWVLQREVVLDAVFGGRYHPKKLEALRLGLWVVTFRER